MIPVTELATLIHFRRTLHRHPELSGQEAATADRIIRFLRNYGPTEIIEGIGGYGLAAVYAFAAEGPTILIRCELDALPIKETNTFGHRSEVAGVAHLCGHDGHMTIVAGLATWLQNCDLPGGKVILLFQPAEETGQGAAAIVKDPKFQTLQPDFSFALHNIPGVPQGEVIVLDAGFSATVQSFSVKLSGKESHASEPEHGVNPAAAVAEMIMAFAQLAVPEVDRLDFALLTPVHLTMGQKAYGISAGSGEVHYTIRTWSDEMMDRLVTQIEAAIDRICAAHRLRYETDWFEFFPATQNDFFCNELIAKAARSNGLSIRRRAVPFKFGEDFGWFTKNYRGAMFGLGAGVDTPALHHPDYDFPDELIEIGVDLFGEVIQQLLK